MWYLCRVGTGEKSSSYFLTNRTYRIGRKGKLNDNQLDIILTGESISRLHAELIVKFDENKCHKLDYVPEILLTDHSTFGTFVNGCKIDKCKSLKLNDEIVFGPKTNAFKLTNEPFIMTTSCVDNEVKVCVKTLVSKLGGYLVNEWQINCKFVLMQQLTVTIKVLNALITQNYIINVNYLKYLIKSCEDETEQPDPANYLPELNEPLLHSNKSLFFPNPKRTTLFLNKTFVFFNDSQYRKMRQTIELAKGKTEIYSEKTHFEKLCDDSYLFIASLNQDSSSDIEKRLSILLERKNKQLINESEIGFAILYTNCIDYCNPNKKIIDNSNEMCGIQSQTLTQIQDIERNTQIKNNNNFDFDKFDDFPEIVATKKAKFDDVVLNPIPEPKIMSTRVEQQKENKKIVSPKVNESVLFKRKFDDIDNEFSDEESNDDKIRQKLDPIKFKSPNESSSLPLSKRNKIGSLDKSPTSNGSINSLSKNNDKTPNSKTTIFSKDDQNTNQKTSSQESTTKTASQNLKKLAYLEKSVKSEPKSQSTTQQSSYTKTKSFVYSKFKPPDGTKITKSENPNETVKILTQCLAKINMVPLKVHENRRLNTTNNTTIASTAMSIENTANSNKRNSKKFVKIPKSNPKNKIIRCEYFETSKQDLNINSLLFK